MKSQLVLTAYTAYCVLSTVFVARASPAFEVIGDSLATGGLQARTLPAGSAAAYFNPALMVDVPASQLSFGSTLSSTQIGVSLDGRPGTQFAVPEGVGRASHSDGTRFDLYPLATRLLQRGRAMSGQQSALAARPRQSDDTGHATRAYGVLGLVVKLFNERLALGFHAMIPLDDFTTLRTFYSDEREQYFSNSLHPELFSDRMTALSVAFGAGLRITSDLSVGIGATVSVTTVAGAQSYVSDTGNLGRILLNLDAPVKVGLAPHFGASYQISRRLRVSATAHAPSKVELESGFTFLLANGIEQAARTRFVHHYKPWLVSLGAAFHLWEEPHSALSVSATLLYGAWSDYQDRHGEQPSEAYAWADTLTPTFGVRWRAHSVSTFVDIMYQPTPVPAQTGRTNYVDNDRLGASLGGEYALSLWGNRVRFGAQLQLQRLLPRHQSKLFTPTISDGSNQAPERVRDEVPDDAQSGGNPVSGAQGLQTNNAGWPGFGSEGWLLGASLYLSISI